MAEVKFELDQGLKSDSGPARKTCVLREATAGDVIESNAEAEKVVLVPVAIDDKGQPVHEPQLVISPSLVSLHRLRRQIVSIGDLKGPIEQEMLFKLSAADLDKIQEKAGQLDEAANKASQAVTQVGRNDEPDGATP